MKRTALLPRDAARVINMLHIPIDVMKAIAVLDDPVKMAMADSGGGGSIEEPELTEETTEETTEEMPTLDIADLEQRISNLSHITPTWSEEKLTNATINATKGVPGLVKDIPSCQTPMGEITASIDLLKYGLGLCEEVKNIQAGIAKRMPYTTFLEGYSGDITRDHFNEDFFGYANERTELQEKYQEYWGNDGVIDETEAKDLQDHIKELREKNRIYQNKIIAGFDYVTKGGWTVLKDVKWYDMEEHTRLFGEYAEHMPGYEEPGLLDDVYTYFENDEKTLDKIYTRYEDVS